MPIASKTVIVEFPEPGTLFTVEESFIVRYGAGWLGTYLITPFNQLMIIEVTSTWTVTVLWSKGIIVCSLRQLRDHAKEETFA